jgi:hypothetical protein
MRRLQREHQTIEKAPPVASTAGEEAIHRGRQPQDAQPFAKQVHGRRRTVDADLPPLGRTGLGTGSNVDFVELGGDGPRAAPVLPRHLGQRCAA